MIKRKGSSELDEVSIQKKLEATARKLRGCYEDIAIAKKRKQLKVLDQPIIITRKTCSQPRKFTTTKRSSRSSTSTPTQPPQPRKGEKGDSKTLCTPFEQPELPEGTRCFASGKIAKKWTYWGRSY